MKNLINCAIVFLLTCSVGFSAYGKAVDQNTARTIGSNFLVSAGISGVNSPSDLSLTWQATANVSGSAITDYYVFNINGARGFVMVSGDDNVIPILAYSGESNFDITKMSPSAKDWIEGYKNQITYVIAHNIPAKAGTADRWTSLLTATRNTTARTTSSGVAPLLSTIWDQEPFYNAMCPPDANPINGLSVTGCVATAMSQVMKFWNWPTVGCGSHTYTDPLSGATLTADYANTAYQWSLMPDSVGSTNNPVATLMYDAGVSVNMQYSASESGSYVIELESPVINCAEYALKTYFHYKPALQGIPRFGEPYGGPTGSGIAAIDDATWISMLQAELNAGRPVLYTGSGSLGGHCWVCDGWETSASMFHFNWGWSGTGPDGYYTIDNLAPPVLGAGGGGGDFNSDQTAIFGIQPDSFPSTPGNIKLLAHLNTATSSPMPYAAPLSITTKILNSAATAYNGSFCALVYDTSNNVVDTIATLTGESIPAGDSTASLTFSSAGLYAMIPVSYYSIRVLYRASGTTVWTPVANNGNFINYTIMDVVNDTDITLFDSLYVGSHIIPYTSPVNVSTTIGNLGMNDFNGTLEAVLINTADGTQYPVQQLTGQYIASNNSGFFNFSSGIMAAPVGLYALEIAQQYNGIGNFYTTGSVFYTNPILISIVGATSVLNPPAAVANALYVYPNPASDVINITAQGLDVTKVSIMDIQGRIIRSMDAPGQSLIAIPVADLAPGIYFVQAQTNTGLVTKKVVISK